MADIKEITKKLEDGVKAVFSSDRYKQYLDFTTKFYDYSVNNCILIMMQKPDASLVAGYRTWQTKFGRFVKKGEKAIQIIAPVPHKIKKEADGEEKEIAWTSYRAVSVFDVSQTDGDELPQGVCRVLDADVEDFDKLIHRLEAISPYPVSYEPIKGSANGFCSFAEGKVVVKQGMSQLQTVKTLVHEISHAVLHSKGGEAHDADRNTREVQAESVAYCVCQMLGLDTSDYSFGYVAGWSGDKDVKALSASLALIQKTANEIVDGIKEDRLQGKLTGGLE